MKPSRAEETERAMTTTPPKRTDDEGRAYRRDVSDALRSALTANRLLSEYMLAMKSCVDAHGGRTIPEDAERITTKLAAVQAAGREVLTVLASWHEEGK